MELGDESIGVLMFHRMLDMLGASGVGLLNCAKVDRILLHPAMWSMIWNGDTEIANLILMGY